MRGHNISHKTTETNKIMVTVTYTVVSKQIRCNFKPHDESLEDWLLN